MIVNTQKTKLILPLENVEINTLTRTRKKKNLMPIIIGDRYCREILRVTMMIPKSAVEINEQTKIPISTVYRRIQTLCDCGLLSTSGFISEDGKKLFLYKSAIKEINIKFDGRLKVDVIRNYSE